ncbi:MAG: hypothetical protein NTZ95_04195, partial [Candidatus Omnitrophica bacterium]|nr:hypothetical protein [Candidatus Omnitrophota bacterium]
AEETRLAEVARQAKLAEEARLAKVARQAKLDEEARLKLEARLKEEARQRTETDRLAEEARQNAETARLADEARQNADKARLAEEKKQKDETDRLAEEDRRKAQAPPAAEAPTTVVVFFEDTADGGTRILSTEDLLRRPELPALIKLIENSPIYKRLKVKIANGELPGSARIAVYLAREDHPRFVDNTVMATAEVVDGAFLAKQKQPDRDFITNVLGAKTGDMIIAVSDKLLKSDPRLQSVVIDHELAELTYPDTPQHFAAYDGIYNIIKNSGRSDANELIRILLSFHHLYLIERMLMDGQFDKAREYLDDQLKKYGSDFIAITIRSWYAGANKGALDVRHIYRRRRIRQNSCHLR